MNPMIGVIFLALLAICLWIIAIYGWLPFLIRGVAKRRKGAGGGWQLAVAGGWMALLAAGNIWFIVANGNGAMKGALVAVLVIGATAWVPLAIWGVARWRRKKSGGKPMTAVAGLWCLLAVSLISRAMVSFNNSLGNYHFQFDPATYTGEVAVVEFPYTGEGNINLSVYPKEPPPYRVFASAVDTNRMTIPTGDYTTAILGVTLKNVHFDFTFDTPFSVTQDEVFVFQGGFPFTASVDVRGDGTGRLSLNFRMVDSAGNAVVVYRSRGKLGFEAVTSGGEVFWRGNLEYG